MKDLIDGLCLYDMNRGTVTTLTGTENGRIKAVGELAAFAKKFNLGGNIWRKYLAYLIATDENAFSLSCERKTSSDDKLNKLALYDCEQLFRLWHYDLKTVYPGSLVSLLDFDNTCDASYHGEAGEKISYLADNLDNAKNERDFLNAIKDYYKKFGVGEFGLYRAFRLVSKSGSTNIELQYITNTERKKLTDLVGYESQKKQLLDNTLAFLDGKSANNVLLYGDGGTGKSSSVKALLNEYSDRGLRIIEVYKHQFTSISELISKIKDRNYRFIIYLDDLSFEEFETEYKYFKAIIEGGIECRPSNVLIYATSNRRHLIKETFADRNDMRVGSDEVHRSDTLAEKLSLVARFGLTILFTSPNQDEYLNIVRALAKRAGIVMDDIELCTRALQWQMRGSGKSGRTAQQFIDSLNN